LPGIKKSDLNLLFFINPIQMYKIFTTDKYQYGISVLSKYVLAMKLCFILVFVSCLQVSAVTFAQRISIRKDQATLTEIFKDIQKQSGYHIFYDVQMIKNARPITIDLSNATLEDVLDHCLKQQALTYSIVDKNIIVNRIQTPKTTTFKKAVDIEVKGKVTDAMGVPLPSVTVQIKGTKVTTTTNSEGNYKIAVAEPDAILVFTFIGFITKEVPVANTTTLNVMLEERKEDLDEVVVLGFGQTQAKIAQTGAISSISTKEIKQSPVANIANALVGRLPGLIAVQRSGEPGADMPELYIRGLATLNSNSPLITIDGVRKEPEALSMLNPNEVESITILKDASATALYGISGANGVIIVQTRRGKEGKPLVNASVQTAVQSPTRLPQYLDSYNFAVLKNEAYLNDNPEGTQIPYSTEALEAYKTGSDPYKYPSVDWLDEMIKPSSMTRADFNISGGVPQVKYFVNVGYTQQGGSYRAEKNDQYDPNLNYKRYNFRSNTDVDFDENFSMSLSLFASIEDKNTPRTTTEQMFTYLLQTTPNAYPIRYPNGMYGGSRYNPFVLLNGLGYVQNFDSSLSGMLSATRKLNFLTEGLFVKANYSFDGYYQNDFTRAKTTRTALYNGVGDYMDPASYAYQESDTPLGSPTVEYEQKRSAWMDLSINYARSFGQHNVTGLLLANRNQRVLDNQIPFVQQGLVSRVTYNFRSKYFGEVNMGYNGSDNFAKGKRYGFFPAFSAGWLASEESFLKNIPVIGYLKVRGSYGLTGNDLLGNRRWLFISEFVTGTGYGYGDPLTNIGGRQEGAMANPNVTWETARKMNIGVETRLWNDAISLTVDFFREKRNDILITRGTVPGMIGVSASNLAPVNMGIIVNRGVEAELTHRKRIGQMNYFVKANGSFARNKILFMDEVDRTHGYLQQTGQSLRQLYGLTSIGFFKDAEDIQNSPQQFGEVIPGDIKYKDLNSDGKIDRNDEGPIGRTTVPELLFGLSSGLSWKNFDFSILFQGAANYNVNFSQASAWEFYNGASVLTHHLNRWTPETAETATYPVLHNGQNENNHRERSSFFMKDASYLRLKNVELGYTFRNVRLTNRTGLSSLRLYANGMNLFTWDKMGEGYFDPEAPSGRGFFYPQLKVINFGLSTDF
jgi:TonB-linked SusC/RagA family outer membrane protein